MTELSVVCTTYPLRTLAGLSFDPPVGAFKFLDGLVFIQMKMIRTPSHLQYVNNKYIISRYISK